MSQELLESITVILRFVLNKRVVFHHKVYVLVSSAGKIDQNHLVLGQCLSQLDRMGNCMAGFEGGDDTSILLSP